MVDKDGGVEEEEHLADPAIFGSPLVPDPLCWIGVPLVFTADRSGRREDEFGAPAFVKRPEDGGAYERGAAAVAGDVVDLTNKVVL